MKRLITSTAICVTFLVASAGADAQGRRASAAQSSPQRSFPSQLERARPAADASRVADERRAEAAARREAAAANNNSEEARVAHPPNEHAAEQAFLAEQNADGRNERAARRELRRENRRSQRD